MNKRLRTLQTTIQAARELGTGPLLRYGTYQMGLRTGHLRRVTPIEPYEKGPAAVHFPFRRPRPKRLAELLQDRAADLLCEADEITKGLVRLFGGSPALLRLVPPDAKQHWTVYEGHPETWGVEDIKLIWEPARFGWVYPLARAYALSGDERYPAAFWTHLQAFMDGNPPNQGPNWSSAQEVALRTLALLFASKAFETSPQSTPERQSALSGAVATHAARIPATLNYALAQNNNHLISEALGLYAAGHALPNHPQSGEWRKLGKQWLNTAFEQQIAPDGTYAQHSMNYHRLMLQAALQAVQLGVPLTQTARERLAAATTWLLAQLDPRSGRVPNLGANDGALILPLASGGFADYRPTAQAAARAFLNRPAFPPGPWDELSLWMGQDLAPFEPLPPFPDCPGVNRLGTPENWATLRAVSYSSRPSQADQLHVDLWWRGENLALDAGTYRYTAEGVWDNALARTHVHNTAEIDGQDQMVRAGRFLWLNWAQGDIQNAQGFQFDMLAAQHDGYYRLGVLHQRILKLAGPGRWRVTDHFLPAPQRKNASPQAQPYTVFLQWLLPDWPWTLDDHVLTLTHPAGGTASLSLTPEISEHPYASFDRVALVRAGEPLIGGPQAAPTLGWYSPTYGVKVPALSFSLRARSPLPITLISDWTLQE